MNLYNVLGNQIAPVYQATALVLLILLAGGLVVRNRLADGEAGLLPDEGFSIRNIFEVLVEMIADQGRSIIGEHYRSYFPLVGSIFFFVLVGNVMGLVPGLGEPATGNVNTAAAWAIIAFTAYNYIGIKEHGWSYINHFLGPAFWQPTIGGKTYHVRVMMPLFLPLELLLHGARVITLTVRLVANMFADHAVVMVWIGIVPIVVPAIFMGLGLFVAFLQAFVFALLTMIYIGLALDEAH
ncbi:MAG: FoF1 ATP synthase subunit a [Myxococcota bacterium]|nr:FoF1 ATP synthase subunit a [Myxococcota bacterium]